MPRISQFHGVSIYLYFLDHNPPHFHAIYGDDEALITIDPPAVLRGTLPSKVLRVVLDWASANLVALKDNWQRAKAGQPLDQVPPAP